MSFSQQAKAPEVVVLNTVAASSADLSVANGFVSISTSRFRRKDVADNAIALGYFLVETAESKNVYVATPVAGTEYRFVIEQEQDGEVKEIFVTYTPSTATGASFATGLTAAVQAKITGGQLKATASAYNTGSLYGVTIVGATGYPVFRVLQTNPSTLTVSSNLASGTSSGNLSASGTTLTLAQGTTTAFAVGQTVKLSGWTGSAVINGRTAAQGVELRVSVVTASTSLTFICDTISGSISAATADYEILAQAQQGSGSSLITLFGSDKGIVSTNVYHIVNVYGLDSSNGNSSYTKNPVPFQKVYLINSTASAANALALMVRIGQVKNWLASGGSFDPALLS